MSNFSIGDLAKDHFDRMYIVKDTKINRDGVIYSLVLLQVGGKPLRPWQLEDGLWACFPTDVVKLNAAD